jgi:thiol:disulfide interchange protein DsbD
MLLCCLVLQSAAPAAYAAGDEEILLPDEAFRFSSKMKNADTLELTWEIADGYYLYRHKFKFVSLTPGREVGAANFPAGYTKKDQFFGTVEIYRGQLQVDLPISGFGTGQKGLVVEVTYQGCADAGVCYMPVQKTVSFD